MQQRQSQFQFQGNGFIGLIMLILFFVALFFIAKGIFAILAWAAPVLIIGAVLISYKTVVGFLKYVWNLLLRNPLVGILAIILAVVGFPVVAGFLFGKAILDRKMRRLESDMRRRKEGDLIDYEDVTEDAEILDLETLPPGSGGRTSYDDFFDDKDQRGT